MNKKRIFFVMALVLLLLGGPASAGWGQEAAPDILAGLTTAYVRVFYVVDGSLTETGPETNQLAADLERRLTDAGLKLVPKEEFDRLVSSRGYPIGLLDLEVRTNKISGVDFKLYYVGLKLQQLSFVARKPVLRFMASTWDITDSGTADDFNAVKGRVTEAVDRFVSDYKAENPK